MSRRILCLMLCLMTVLSLGTYALANSQDQVEDPAAPAAEEPAVRETGPQGPWYLVNGQIVEDPGMTVIEGAAYVSLRTMVQALRPDAVVTWDGSCAVASMEGITVRARLGDLYIESNGRYFFAPSGVRSGHDRLLVPVRVMAQAMGAVVAWNSGTGKVEVYSGCGAVTPAENFYNADELYWMSHIINAESGDEPFLGKIAVGTVVMNRVADSRFPDSIFGVISAPGQFTPYRTGSINREPNEDSVIAAKLCLEGARVLNGSLYFLDPVVSPNAWATRNRPYITTIGGHAFYG